MIKIRYDATPTARNPHHGHIPKVHVSNPNTKHSINTGIYHRSSGLGYSGRYFSFPSLRGSVFVSVIRFVDDAQVRGEAFGRCVWTSMNLKGLESGVSGKLSCNVGVMLR